QRPLTQGTARVADQEGGVGALLHAEALAGRAPAERTVEREMVRIEPLEAPATALAGEVQTVLLDAPLWFRLVVLDVGDVQHAATQLQRCLDGVGDARPRRT